jgi:serine/threonine protein kinase
MDATLLPALPGYDHPELIAHGTTALVYRAIQSTLNRHVAIKVITADTAWASVNAERELAMTVALSSQPHIVSIIDTGVTEDARPYIVMEYCEDGSYARILRQQGPLAVDDVAEVGVKIGEALHAAHDVGIVHRDVKPSNILRSRFGPALTDFGVARAPDELGGTLTREMMTPHHASPEALLHQAQSGLSDVYSLASTMWMLLVGYPPFVDPTRPAIDLHAFRDRVLHEPVPAMPRDDVPSWLVAELTRAMSKQPSQRHGGAIEFAEAVHRGSLGLVRISPAPTTAVPVQPLDATTLAGPPVPVWYRDPSPVEEIATQPPRLAPPVIPSPVEEIATQPPRLAPRAVQPAPAPESADQEPPADEPSADEGGWRGTPTDIEAEPQQPSRPEFDLGQPPTLRRPLPLALLLGVILALVIGAIAVLVGGRSRDDANRSPGPSASAGTTRFLTPATEGAPLDVRLTDHGASIGVTWRDPSDGTVPFGVVIRKGDGTYLDPVQVPQAETTVTITGLDPRLRYCFVVVAVYDVTRSAAAPEKCTDAVRAPPS